MKLNEELPVVNEGFSSPVATTSFCVVQSAAAAAGIKKYSSRQSRVVGVTLIVCAVLSFVCNGVDLGFVLNQFADERPRFTGIIWGVACHGYWTGLPVTITSTFVVRLPLFHHLTDNLRHIGQTCSLLIYGRRK